MNLVDARAEGAQSALLSITKEPVANVLNDARKLTMPTHHDVRAKDVDLKRLGAVLAMAHEEELRDFASLLLVEGLGPRTLPEPALYRLIPCGWIAGQQLVRHVNDSFGIT